MDYGRLLVQALHMVRRMPFLWLAGGAAALGGPLLSIWLRLSGRPLLSRLLDLNNPPPLPDQNDLLLFTGAAILVGLLLWLLNIWGEAVLIEATGRWERGEQVTGRQAVRAARRHLLPFIALDSLLFLPLLLISLLALIGSTAIFVTSVLGVTNELLHWRQGLWLLGGGTLLCVIPLLCLSAVVTLLILLLRVLAFRAHVLDGLPVRASLRHTWQLLRRHTFTILLVAVLLWAVRRLVTLVAGIVTVPLDWLAFGPLLGTLSAAPPAAPTGWTAVAAGLLSGLITLFLAALLHAYAAAAWTIAYNSLETA